LALLPRLAFLQRQAWAVGLSPNPLRCGLKLTRLASSAELEGAGSGTKQPFASPGFSVALRVRAQPRSPLPPPSPPPAGGFSRCCNRRRLGRSMGKTAVAGVEGACIQQPPLWIESCFSCVPAARAAFSQRALFILLNPVNERCRMKSADGRYQPVTQQLLHGQCLAEQLPPLSPCGAPDPPRAAASRAEFEGQSAFAVRAAVQASLVSQWLYRLVFLRGLLSSVAGVGSQGLGPLRGGPLCSPLRLFFQGIVKLEHPRIHVDFPVIICEV